MQRSRVKKKWCPRTERVKAVKLTLLEPRTFCFFLSLPNVDQIMYQGIASDKELQLLEKDQSIVLSKNDSHLALSFILATLCMSQVFYDA